MNQLYSGFMVKLHSQVQKFLEENQKAPAELDRGAQEAEDGPPCLTGEEQQIEQSAQGGSAEVGGEDPDCRTWVQPQQGTDLPRRQLTSLEIPDFLQTEAAEGS